MPYAPKWEQQERKRQTEALPRQVKIYVVLREFSDTILARVNFKT
jgi:hypothetical protein